MVEEEIEARSAIPILVVVVLLLRLSPESSSCRYGDLLLVLEVLVLLTFAVVALVGVVPPAATDVVVAR